MEGDETDRHRATAQVREGAAAALSGGDDRIEAELRVLERCAALRARTSAPWARAAVDRLRALELQRLALEDEATLLSAVDGPARSRVENARRLVRLERRLGRLRRRAEVLAGLGWWPVVVAVIVAALAAIALR